MHGSKGKGNCAHPHCGHKKHKLGSLYQHWMRNHRKAEHIKCSYCELLIDSWSYPRHLFKFHGSHAKPKKDELSARMPVIRLSQYLQGILKDSDGYKDLQNVAGDGIKGMNRRKMQLRLPEDTSPSTLASFYLRLLASNVPWRGLQMYVAIDKMYERLRTSSRRK
jgi:hypothetical protein